MPNLDNSISNFGRAVATLKSFLKVTNPDELQTAGIIQGFEFCFELCWKTLKKRFEAEGLSIASPKAGFQAAFQAGIISDQKVWLDILNDRNLTAY